MYAHQRERAVCAFRAVFLLLSNGLLLLLLLYDVVQYNVERTRRLTAQEQVLSQTLNVAVMSRGKRNGRGDPSRVDQTDKRRPMYSR